MCLAYSVLANRYLDEKRPNRNQPSAYKLEELNLDGVHFPCAETDVINTMLLQFMFSK